jgi:hypothetical protein
MGFFVYYNLFVGSPVKARGGVALYQQWLKKMREIETSFSENDKDEHKNS